MIRDILIWPSPRLKEVSVAVPVEEVSATAELVQDMIDTMYDSGGVGLAAIQIGVALRLFVMEVKTGPTYVFINPVITVSEGTLEQKNEGCLSLPGIVETVNRYPKVTVTALDRDGKPFTATFTGIEAQCCQHEIEHLDGIMIPDKLDLAGKQRILKAMKTR